MSAEEIKTEEIKKALEEKKKKRKKFLPKPITSIKIDDGLPKIKNTYDGSTLPKKIKIDDDLPKIKNTYGPHKNSQKISKQMLKGGGIAIRGLGRAFQKGGKV
jgi:hypothetical protein